MLRAIRILTLLGFLAACPTGTVTAQNSESSESGDFVTGMVSVRAQHPDSLRVTEHSPLAPLPEMDEQPFGVPRPVSSEPFDYATLDAGNYDLSATRISESIKLDGMMDESVWQQAVPATNFYQLEPSEGYPASQPTEVRVLYDDKNLYIGFMCYDAEPGRIRAPDMQRDSRIAFSNDMVQVVIAPLEGGREAYSFQVNPNGARTDSFVSKEGASQDQDWNGLWDAAARRHAQGWSVEYLIPFHALRFPDKEEQFWSINFGRRIQRHREESYWVPLNREDGDRGLYRFQKGGRLVGLQNLKPGGKIQVMPFTVLGAEGTRKITANPTPALPIASTNLDTDTENEFGADLKWSVTSGLTFNATVNPDFAQVEADDQVVNLSRFEFRFDEKRPFFLERSDIFKLGPSSNRGGPGRGGSSTPELFFSRRVGRQLPDGTSVPVDLGMRLTGKVGKTTIGYLNVQTRESDYEEDGVPKTEPLTNWQALRVFQDIGARSSVGLLATFKEPSPGLHKELGTVIPRFADSNYNRTLGFDAILASSRTQHEVQVMLARSWTDTLQDKSAEGMWRVAHRWRNRLLEFNTSYMDLGDNFIAQSGFVRQNNIRRLGNRTSFSPFIRKYGIRRINPSISTEYIAPADDSFSDPETWRMNPSVTFELEAGVWLTPGYTRTFDTLEGPSNTQIAGVHFGPGTYTYDQFNLFIGTDSSRPVSTRGSATIGRFYGGDLISVSNTLTFKPSNQISFAPGLTWNKLERNDRIGLAADEYDYSNRIIPNFRFNYSFTPNLALSTFMQFNADKNRPADDFHLNTTTANFLISYRSPFGHTFFFAINQFHDDDLDTDPTASPFERTPLRLRDQTVVAKMSYLFNL